jgi:hypothetical protein
MPVQETVDAIAELRAVGMPIGGVVVNQVRDTILDPKALKTAARSKISREEVASDLTRVNVRATDAVVDGLLAEARDHAERVALEHDASMVIAELRRPTYQLPSLSEGVDANGIRELAETLITQGMA